MYRQTDRQIDRTKVGAMMRPADEMVPPGAASSVSIYRTSNISNISDRYTIQA